MRYTKQQIMEIIEEEDIEFIRMQFTDIFGTLKNIAITSSQIEKALDNKIMFDASSIDGFTGVEASDMYLHPDLDTFEIFPWRPQQGKVARFVCDVYRPDGLPFEGDPRFVLKRVLNEAADMGFDFLVGPELEFFLFHTDDNGVATTISHEKAGYFDISPIDMGENARRDMVLTLEQMDFEIEASHHEAAPAQHEIDFKYEDALNIADKIMTFKLAVKSIATRHGLHATFMPKPKEGQCGSGMHINMSLCKDGKNIFADENDELGLSKEAYHFIAGLMNKVKAMTAITNPLVNSYKRFVPGYEAPVCIAWSAKNRSPLIRIPATRGESTRVEFRSPDPSANPYLVLAVCLAAGLDGIKRELEPAPQVVGNIFEKAQMEGTGIEKLPINLQEAIKELEKDDFIKNVLGEHLYTNYVAKKKEEWEEYRSIVTDWEIEKYLNRF